MLRSIVLIWVLVLGGQVWASKPRCRLEQVYRNPEDGNLIALASVVELEGQIEADRPAKGYTLLLDGSSLGQAKSAKRFSASGLDGHLVLAVETSGLYSQSFEKIKEALGEFLPALPQRLRVKLLPFGNELDTRNGFVPPAAVAVDDLTPDDEGDIQLVNAIRDAMRALNKVPKPTQDKPRPPPRRLIVVLSDGLNPSLERRMFSKLGEDLRSQGVALFPVAFSPRDDRIPLLNLGELAKRSAGTFRWAKTSDNLKEQFLSLAEELSLLQVLTFESKAARKVDEEELQKGVFSLKCGELRSNPFSQRAELAKEVKGKWLPTWARWVLGIVVGLGFLWGLARLALLLLERRERRAAQVLAQPLPPTAQPGTPGVQPGATGGYPAQGATGGYPAQPAAQPLQPVQPTAQHGRVVTLSGPAVRGEAVIVLIGGRLAGQRIPVGKGLTLGKSVSGPSTLPILDDPTVSSRHLELRVDERGGTLAVWAIDLGSTNGTFVNEARLSQPVLLRDGDLLRIGQGTQFKYRVD